MANEKTTEQRLLNAIENHSWITLDAIKDTPDEAMPLMLKKAALFFGALGTVLQDCREGKCGDIPDGDLGDWLTERVLARMEQQA